MIPGFQEESFRGQPFLRYTLPGLGELFSASLFLKGPFMDGAGGDPSLSRASLLPLFPGAECHTAPIQVHGTTLIQAGAPGTNLPLRPEGDGILIEKTGTEGSLRFADCFPVVLFSHVPSPWLAILHSGFKGTVDNIAGLACRKIFSMAGRSPRRTWAWIGPGIGGDFYCRPRSEAWTEKGLESFSPAFVKQKETSACFFLGDQIRLQLLEEGIGEENIFSFPFCTFRDNRICYSYRRGDMANRLFLLAFLKSA